MLRKGQIEGIMERDVLAQHRLITRMFGVAASGVGSEERPHIPVVFATHPA